MWLYIFTAALCVFLWKFLRWLMSYVHRYRATAKALSKFPLLEEHHWFYGISHAVSKTVKVKVSHSFSVIVAVGIRVPALQFMRSIHLL